MKRSFSDVKMIAGLISLMGLWLILSPWLFGLLFASESWNYLLAGTVIAASGLARFLYPEKGWINAVAAAAGLWLLAAPFIFNYQEASAYWNETIVGLVTTLMAVSDLDMHLPHRHHHTHA